MAWYALDIRKDGDSWLVTSPDFEELVTFGETKQDAEARGLDAIEEAIAGRIADSEPIPPPKLEEPEGFRVELSLLVGLKAGLYMLMREEKKTRADLGRELGWHREQVDRLFRLDHNSRIDQLEEAFKALGHPLRFNMPVLDAA